MDDELERILEAARDGGNAAAKIVSDYIDKVTEGMRMWISVEDCLPDDDCRVLGWDGTRVSEVHFHVRAKESDRWYSLAGHESPTHWMPLPAPPTDGK